MIPILICVIILGLIITFLLMQLIKDDKTIEQLAADKLRLFRDNIETVETYEKIIEQYNEDIADLRMRLVSATTATANESPTAKVEISAVEYDLAQMGREK